MAYYKNFYITYQKLESYTPCVNNFKLKMYIRMYNIYLTKKLCKLILLILSLVVAFIIKLGSSTACHPNLVSNNILNEYFEPSNLRSHGKIFCCHTIKISQTKIYLEHNDNSKTC